MELELVKRRKGERNGVKEGVDQRAFDEETVALQVER